MYDRLSILPKHEPERPLRHYDLEYAQDDVVLPERGISPELELNIREGSAKEETLKMNLEGHCETVRKETGC